MKQFGLNSQSLTDDMFNRREVTPAVSATPSYGDSQPIPSTCLERDVQLTNKGSPNLTTTSGGVISSAQEELTPVPVSIKYVLKSAVQAVT